MTQSTILTAGNTLATSSDVVVSAGTSVSVGLFGAAGTSLPIGYSMLIMMDTPDGDNILEKLNPRQMQVQVYGPGTFRVVRPFYVGPAFGVFLET